MIASLQEEINQRTLEIDQRIAQIKQQIVREQTAAQEEAEK